MRTTPSAGTRPGAAPPRLGRSVALAVALFALGTLAPGDSFPGPHADHGAGHAHGSGEPLPDVAPDEYSVRLFTTDGVILIDVTRAWAPGSADRFFNLVTTGYYDGSPFHRVVGGYLAQFGLRTEPHVSDGWIAATADPRTPNKNTAGMVAFVPASEDGPRDQIVISVKDNADLDARGLVPFGKVRDLYVADNLYFGYAEGPPAGKGPDPDRVLAEGMGYLTTGFAKLDWVRRARVASPPGGGLAGPQLPTPRRAKRRLGPPRPRPQAPSHGGGGGGGGHSH